MVLNLPPYLRIVGGRQCGLEMLLVGSQRQQEDETDILGDGDTPCFVLGAFMRVFCLFQPFKVRMIISFFR